MTDSIPTIRIKDYRREKREPMDEKRWEQAREQQGATYDAQLETIEDETRELIREHVRDFSNEVLAEIALEAFRDGCDALDLHGWLHEFKERFPTLGEYV